MEQVLPFSQASLLLLGVGTLIPLAVTFLTKWDAPDWVKNVMTAGLAIAAGFIQQGINAVANNEDFSWQEVGQGILLAWASAAFAYVKLWKNTPINVGLSNASAGFGVSGQALVQPVAEPEAGVPTGNVPDAQVGGLHDESFPPQPPQPGA